MGQNQGSESQRHMYSKEEKNKTKYRHEGEILRNRYRTEEKTKTQIQREGKD